MTPEEIRQIVRITLDELDHRKLNYTVVHKKVSDELRTFFNDTKAPVNKAVFYSLKQLSDDPYIDVIYSHYRDGLTLEEIADLMDKDVSTIKRNKKRLILKIYELLEVCL